MRLKSTVATGVVLVSVLAVTTVHRSQPITAALATQARQPVIALLRDQPTGGARTFAPGADQLPLINQLKAAGATGISQFRLVNGFAATVTPAQRDQLANDPRVAAVLPDRPIRLADQPAAPTGPTGPAQPLCPADPSKPLLEPEALQVTNAAFADPSRPQAQSLATGQGVKVAYLADGVDTANPDFVRPDGTKVFSDYQDFTGEGTATTGDDREAFGDASTIAAQGRQRYDLSDVAALPKGCTIRVLGMAPGASLVGLKVVASNGFGSTSALLQAIDYAVTVDHVDVLNESLGGNPYPDHNTDPFTLANRAAIAAGTTVVASAGDAGYRNTIGSPASDPTVITVGASTTFRLQAQVRSQLPGMTGWESDNVSAISSGGVAQNGRVDDLLAPGDEGWALCTANAALYQGCVNYQGKPAAVQPFGGTSEAAPLVAGAAALVIEAYQNAHGGIRPTPAQVKQILTSTATDEYDPADRQGAGLLNALAAVRAAQGSDGLLFDSGQFTATDAPGAAEGFNLRVTNVGKTARTITAHGRALSTVTSDDRGAIQLDTTAPAPTFPGPSGTPEDYVTQPFTVPAGADHLDASIAWQSPTGPPIAMAVLDPKGDLAGFTLPQAMTGPDFGHVDAHTPMPGVWHAVIYGRRAATGFSGLVSYRFTTSKYAPFGAVTPGTLTLAPGQSGQLRITASTPAQPGDQVAAMELDTAGPNNAAGPNSTAGQRFALPVVLRSLLSGDFSGTITGGNGRGGSPAQQNTYLFDMPAGKRDADIDVTLDGDVRQQVYGYLVSPDGQILSQATTVRATDANGDPTAFTASLRSTVHNPRPGRWSYVVIVANPVSGSTTDERFTGHLRFDQVDITAAGLPNGAVLPAGRPRTFTVRVHNTAGVPESFFVDPRSTAVTDLRLAADGAESGVSMRPFAQAGYVVPTETTGLVAVASGSAPVTADLAAATGQPEVFGTPGPDNVAMTYVDSPAVSPGSWLLQADPVGPFGGSTPGTADLELFAHTLAFDPAATSSTGDVWQHGTKATPLAIAAGQTGTITVTLTPDQARGAAVAGFLCVDDTAANGSADELISIPYHYTVG